MDLCHLKNSELDPQDYQDAQDKQQMQFPLVPRSKMEDAPTLLKIPKIGVSRHLDSSTTTQMA